MKEERGSQMNDELREIIAEEMDLYWCPIVNSYVASDCFNYCYTCNDYIEFNEYFNKQAKRRMENK